MSNRGADVVHLRSRTPAPGAPARATDAHGRPVVRVSTSPDAVRRLGEAVDGGVVPGVYVHDGTPVVLERVSGTAAPVAGDDDAPLPVAMTQVSGPVLAGLLARHVCVVRPKKVGQNEDLVDEETMPSQSVLSAVLARREWAGLPALRAMIGAPVLRPDGTLLQDPGYDPATGYFLAPTIDVGRVDDEPTAAQVRAAREFLLARFLADFPWKSAADRANYVGALVTQILRPFTRALAPFVVVDATMPASGKTILTSCLGMLYGQRVLTWTDSEEELRKSITTILADSVGAIVFDNIPEGHVIDSAVLARLVTERTWTDRRLGSNTAASFANDRLWLATGNNLRTGADMASRTVWVHLDPDCPRPEARSGFTIPNLDTWILDPVNQALVLRAVLTLVLDWTRAGAPVSTSVPAMRQFTRWAQTTGGFLDHHHIGGFLANAEDARDLDEDAAEWRAFLLTWHRKFAGTQVTAHAVRASADPGPDGTDPWDGTFVTGPSGKVPTVKGLGRLLTGQAGRWRGDIVLRTVTDSRDKGRSYWVERTSDRLEPLN